MSATFPFVDPFIRLENALWSVFHRRGNKALAGVLTSLWEIWSLQPAQHHRVLASRSALLKVVVLRILGAVSLHSSTRSFSIDQLYTLLQLLHSIVNGSVILQHFTKQLDAGSTIDQIQHRFSEFTSGWKLCADLCEVLSCSFIVCQEFAIDGLDCRVPQDEIGAFPVIDDGTCSVISVKTSCTVVSTKHAVAAFTAHFELKRAHYQSAVAKDVVQEDNPTKKFKLKTLEEHRYATRFQKKRVTPKTWRSALCEAHELIQSGDRVNLVEALYLLLEIITLNPHGCNLATMYLDTGSIYLVFDHLEEAAKAYRNSLRHDESNWKARYNLGVAAARLQDFVEATRQLTLALKACPADITEEIGSMLKEIDRIQCSKNSQAFHKTMKARLFTTQYLESLQLVSGVPKKAGVSNPVVLQEDHTVSLRNGLALTSSTPQVLDVSHEWQGSLASLLHRLHVVAWYRHLSIQDEMLRLDPTRGGGISLQTFNEVVTRMTGVPLRITERKELTHTLGDDGTVIFHFLPPNAASMKAIDELQHQDACHTLLEWNLYRKRAKRSANSRAGGLWYWFDLTMTKWIEQVLPQHSPKNLHDHTTLSLKETLMVNGWLTLMDFAWKWRYLPEPSAFPMLQLAHRGIFIYECHRARNCIQEEASRTLQMFLRRFLIRAKWRKHTGPRYVYHEVNVNNGVAYLEDVHTRLAKDTFHDQQVAREVLQCIEDMIDDVVFRDRQEQKTHEDKVRWQEIPLRTEQRQKIISAIGTNGATQTST